MSTIPPWFALPEHQALKPGYLEKDDIKQVIVVGSGLAGSHTAYEIAQHGIHVLLIDASDTIAGGASASTAGIVKPFVTRDPGLADAFYKTAFEFLINRLDTNKPLRDASQFNQCGVLQLLERAYPESEAYNNCTPEQSSKIAGTEINAQTIQFEQGGWLNPAALCKAIVQHPNIEIQLQTRVNKITQTPYGWSLTKAKGDFKCEVLILANGNQLNRLAQTTELPITPARGQTSRFACNKHKLKTVVTGKRYAIPENNTVIVGASFLRNNQDDGITAKEHQENLSGLNTLLPSLSPSANALSGYSGIRATTPDRLPMVGPVPEFTHYRTDYALLKNGLPNHSFTAARYQKGLFVIGGFGSRGIVSAPYCARLLAQYLCSSSSDKTDTTDKLDATKLDATDQIALKHTVPSHIKSLASWSALLHPGRFIVRDLKRSHHLVHSTCHE